MKNRKKNGMRKLHGKLTIRYEKNGIEQKLELCLLDRSQFNGSSKTFPKIVIPDQFIVTVFCKSL